MRRHLLVAALAYHAVREPLREVVDVSVTGRDPICSAALAFHVGISIEGFFREAAFESAVPLIFKPDVPGIPKLEEVWPLEVAF